jgi:hypothetical protein
VGLQPVISSLKVKAEDIKEIKKDRWMGGYIGGYRPIDRGMDS